VPGDRPQHGLVLISPGGQHLILDPSEVSLGSARDLEQATGWALTRLDAGMDDFISKPIREDALAVALEQWVRPGGQQAA